MNEESPFNTPTDEVKRLVEEFRETKEALRGVSKRLSQIEVRMQRLFPSLMPKNAGSRREKEESAGAEPTLTPEEAMHVYDELVALARTDNHQSVHDRLGGLGLADLNLLRQELGISLGKKKPSRKVLEEAVIGRIRESVLLSRHSNREHTASQPDSAPNSTDDERKTE
jgi:hypothetical protein